MTVLGQNYNKVMLQVTNNFSYGKEKVDYLPFIFNTTFTPQLIYLLLGLLA